MYRLAYEDIAIPIAWPDQTARGDENWYAILKKLGVIKNLNFKVGHAAIILVKKNTGEIRYFDFGRYITPRGYGRARSEKFDPRLKINSKAIIKGQEIQNLSEILSELESMAEATHGGGRLFCSQAAQINFEKGIQFAEAIVDQGPVLYGALAQKNNSCSRYVAQILTAAMAEDDPRKRDILFPESLKPSPFSNVVNAVRDRNVYCYSHNRLDKIKMNRFTSLRFQISLLKDNFYADLAQLLPDDTKPGKIDEWPRPAHISESAQWLGGIGEGVWFEIKNDMEGYEIRRYHSSGKLDYAVIARPDHLFDNDRPFELTYQVHYEKHVIIQDGISITFRTHHASQIDKNLKKIEELK